MEEMGLFTFILEIKKLITRNKVNVFEDDLTNIYNSRTFCLFEDVEKLKKMNLAKGGTLENAIVVKGQKILNKNGLRSKKEFVNHKILDCMGDLYLSGYKIIGSIKCSQGGHSLTNQLLRKVFREKNNYSIFEIKEKTIIIIQDKKTSKSVLIPKLKKFKSCKYFGNLKVQYNICKTGNKKLQKNNMLQKHVA